MQRRVREWIMSSCKTLGLKPERSLTLEGAVFEIRQGYKSADSKRQNADLRSAVRAYNEGLLPAMMLVSTQVNSTIHRRYLSSQMLVLVGSLSDDPVASTFAFYDKVLGYSLAGFFERNSETIRREIEGVLDSLLRAK